MNIGAKKAMIIEQVNKVSDIDLIIGIKSVLDYADNRDQEIYNIPVAHQRLVMDRFEKTREDFERLLDWDEAKELVKINEEVQYIE